MFTLMNSFIHVRHSMSSVGFYFLIIRIQFNLRFLLKNDMLKSVDRTGKMAGSVGKAFSTKPEF